VQRPALVKLLFTTNKQSGFLLHREIGARRALVLIY